MKKGCAINKNTVGIHTSAVCHLRNYPNNLMEQLKQEFVISFLSINSITKRAKIQNLWMLSRKKNCSEKKRIREKPQEILASRIKRHLARVPMVVPISWYFGFSTGRNKPTHIASELTLIETRTEEEATRRITCKQDTTWQ